MDLFDLPLTIKQVKFIVEIYLNSLSEKQLKKLFSRFTEIK